MTSTRLPRKPLADICGKPMVVRTAERALASGAQAVAVACDSEDIVKGYDLMASGLLSDIARRYA